MVNASRRGRFNPTLLPLAFIVMACGGPAGSSATPIAATSGPLISPLVLPEPTADATAIVREIVTPSATKIAVLATLDAVSAHPRPTPTGTRLPYPDLSLVTPRPPQTSFRGIRWDGDPAGDGFIAVMMDPTGRQNHLSLNVWYVDTPDGSDRLAVFAGGPRDGAGRTGPEGHLLIYRSRIDPVTGTITNTEAGTLFLTPQATGIVKITGAVGDTLDLVSTSGVKFRFSVALRQFVP